MGFFDIVAKAKQMANRTVNPAYRGNKDFLEAAAAASALAASADGTVDSAERSATQALLEQHTMLSQLYSTAEIRNAVSSALDKATSNAGKQQLARELDDLKKHPTGAQMAEDVYWIAVDVAAEGDTSDAEKAILAKLAQRLNVDVGEAW